MRRVRVCSIVSNVTQQVSKRYLKYIYWSVTCSLLYIFSVNINVYSTKKTTHWTQHETNLDVEVNFPKDIVVFIVVLYL